MTVQTTQNRADYNGNGVTTTFAVPFRFLLNTDLSVIYDDGAGSVITLSFPADYSVSGARAPGGGSITLNAIVPSALARISILRNVPETQLTDYIPNDPFPSESHEDALDKLTMLVQQQQEEITRSIKYPPQIGSDGTLPAPDGTAQVVGFLPFEAGPQLIPLPDLTSGVYNPGFVGSVTRTIGGKLRETVSVKDFGAVGDGVADDTAAVQAAVNYVSENGGMLYIPAGVYLVKARIFRATSAKPFIIQGAGENATVIKRASNFNASVMEFRLSHNVVVNDLTIDGNNALFPSGNHGLVIFDSDRPKVNRVTVVDWKNSGILVYAVGGSRSGARINDCSVFGMGVSPVGILISGMKDSGMDGCSAYGVDNVAAGADGYGLELKNECDGCFITNGYAQDCFAAAAFGEDIGTTAVKNSRVSVFARACKFAFACGRSENNHIDIIAEMAGVASGEQVVDLQTNSIGNTVRVTTRDVVASKRVVRIRSGCTDNVVFVDCVGSLPASSVVALFDAGSERNTVQLARIGGTPMPAAGYAGLVIDSSTAGNNTFRYSLYPRFESQTIASGVISIKDPSAESVIVDTEAAAATDDLDSINGPTFEGKVISLRTAANARDVVVKHLSAGGNIRLNGLADFTLDGVADTLTLRWNSAISQWCEVARSNNA